MFQDGSVKAVLAKSSSGEFFLHISVIRNSTPDFAFCKSKYLHTDHFGYLPPLRPNKPLFLQVASFYRFNLNGFKSFNPLFKALFIFPSQYLFAIGFSSIFSLGRSLSPYLSCNTKQLDSVSSKWICPLAKYGDFTLFVVLFQGNLYEKTPPC